MSNNTILAAEEFDSLFFDDAPFSEFNRLFNQYGKDCPEIFKHMHTRECMLTPDFINQCDRSQLYAILKSMRDDKEEERARAAAKVVLDRRIPAAIRAVFWNSIRNIASHCSSAQAIAFGLWGNEYVFEAIRKYGFGQPEDLSFVKQVSSLDLERSVKTTLKPGREQLENSIRLDSIPMFEINRELLRIDIGTPLMECLIRKGAVRIFFYIFSEYPKAAFKARSVENWLFAIVNSKFDEEKTIIFIDAFEQKYPGIVARIRDPWGNSLFWYASHSRMQYERLQNHLIQLGCKERMCNMLALSEKDVEENVVRKYAMAFIRKYQQ